MARDLIGLLEQAVTPAGTGAKAAVPGYRVAGKTGTAWKSVRGGYSQTSYLAMFGGVVPASAPRLAVRRHGRRAARVTSITAATSPRRCSLRLTSGALRLMSVAPDDLARVTPVGHAGEAP